MKKAPKFLKPYLWSYNIKKIDPEKDKKLIVNVVLNWGDGKSTKWLFKFYGKKEVSKIANNIPKGQWDRRSLNFWRLFLDINPRERIRLKT